MAMTDYDQTYTGDWRLAETTGLKGFPEEQKKKDLILLCAASLFANKGYAGTSVRAIVEAAGITKPTLYYYFKNKEDLYVKLLDQAMESFFLILDEARGKEGNMRQRLVGLFTAIYQFLRDNIDLLRLINSIIYGPAGSKPDYDLRSRHGPFENILAEILQAGIKEGELREDNREGVMLLLMGILRSVQVLLVIDPPRIAHAQELIPKTINLIFDSAKTPSHAGDRQ